MPTLAATYSLTSNILVTLVIFTRLSLISYGLSKANDLNISRNLSNLAHALAALTGKLFIKTFKKLALTVL